MLDRHRCGAGIGVVADGVDEVRRARAAAHGLPEESRREAGAALEPAHRGGVTPVFGTDLLGGMHRHQLDEFRIRGQVQPPADVLRAATVHAARLLGLDDRLGRLAPGYLADLVVVDGNPPADLAALTAGPRMVVKNGVVHHNEL